MTREEAIELLDILPLCNECDSSNFPYTCAECGDAFLLAMEALKQPEVVRCKDCAKQCTDNCLLYWNDINTPDNWYCADGVKRE